MDLIGRTTEGGWLVGEQITFSDDHTGGNFSVCYSVTRSQEKAFLKALDIEKFDPNILSMVLSGFQHETKLVNHCRDKQLTRVIQVLESGQLDQQNNLPPILRFVPFLIFELAHKGDIRSSLSIGDRNVTDEWRFRILHQTSLALLQLHNLNIAHQDVKPSNVLRFEKDTLKLGDLGRSSMKGLSSPHDELPIPGALNYAPFEQRYGYLAPDWIERRQSGDVFHLGCLLVFSFTNICFPEFVMQKVASAYKPEFWGNHYSEALPFLLESAIKAVNELSIDFPDQYRNDLVTIILDLCHPDPALRGRSGLIKKSQPLLVSLHRYASIFDRLGKRARINMRRDNV